MNGGVPLIIGRACIHVNICMALAQHEPAAVTVLLA
jgi:hypothetical protein